MSKKKIVIILLALLAIAVLCFCLFRHTYAPATCTDPEICTRCGKTRGEPLGHTEVIDPAVEPTCTEPGYTEGSHCSVCDEVLIAQEEIPPLGHDWKGQGFTKPMICARCGEESEEILGSDFFIRALHPENAAAPEVEEKTFPSFSKVVTVKADCSGIDDSLDRILKLAKLTLVINSAEQTGMAIRAELKIPLAESYTGYVTVSDEHIGVMLPDFSDEYFLIEPSLLTGLNSADVPQYSLRKYEEILFSIADISNTTEEEGTYSLGGLGKTVDCTILTVTPTAADWQAMLEKFADTALADDELMEYLEIAFGQKYDQSFYARLQYTREEYIAESLDSIRAALTGLRENAPAFAEDNEGMYLQVAYDGTRAYSARLIDNYDTGYGYESFGDIADSRDDAIVLYEWDGENYIMADCTLSKAGDDLAGQLLIPEIGATVGFSAKENDVLLSFIMDDANVTAAVTIADTEERVMLPEHRDRLISTQEELEEAIAEFFQ